ncbi:MAG: T9SS type A sorting domain-containing protein, partial [Bacteroidales bacterium]|nr:T9SS type A sorting domain-containing protein [Bacteroidales bacterium]
CNPLNEEVYIYTLSGTLIGSVKGNSVDLSKQPAGVYVLRIGNKAAGNAQSLKSVRIIKK